jgi:hypothetical protein
LSGVEREGGSGGGLRRKSERRQRFLRGTNGEKTSDGQKKTFRRLEEAASSSPTCELSFRPFSAEDDEAVSNTRPWSVDRRPRPFFPKKGDVIGDWLEREEREASFWSAGRGGGATNDLSCPEMRAFSLEPGGDHPTKTHLGVSHCSWKGVGGRTVRLWEEREERRGGDEKKERGIERERQALI